MNDTPLVSIVMPVYNAAQYLEEALVSILIQSYTKFELLAINDGSTDNSIAILEKYAQNDKRIRIISQKNAGIVAVLNRGIKQAKGDLIARMDADDVSFPHRLEEQVEVLMRNPEVALVYGDFEVIDEQSRFVYRELIPPLNEDIQRALFLRNPIAHGSVMFRKSIIDEVGPYSDKFGPTEDLELWMRISERAPMIGTATTLYRWRINTNGLTMTNNGESVRKAKQHIENRWERLQPAPTSRQDTLSRSRYYLDKYPQFGHFYKMKSLEDRAQIATKFIRNKHFFRGFKELIIVASTGRLGTRIVFTRLFLLFNVYRGRLLKQGGSDD